MDPMTWFAVINMVMSFAGAAQQARQQKKVAQQQAEAANQAAKERWDAYEDAEKKRQDNLKKALAKKRARMGASGFSAADGSAGAIMQGLRTDAAEESFDAYQETKKEVDTTLANIQSSLLEKSNASNRQLYSQLGSTVGGMAGSFIEKTDPKDPKKVIGNYGSEGSQLGAGLGSFA